MSLALGRWPMATCFGLQATYVWILFFIFLLDQGPVCGATDCYVLDLVCPSSWVSNPEWISCLHTFLLVCSDSKVTSSVALAFSTNRGIHCMSVYVAWQLSHFDPRTCSLHTYPQELVVPRFELGLEPMAWVRAQTHNLLCRSTAHLITWPFQLRLDSTSPDWPPKFRAPTTFGNQGKEGIFPVREQSGNSQGIWHFFTNQGKSNFFQYNNW